MIDYEKIRKDNRENYGKVGANKYGKRMSQDLYADRTHFIYELLQNAEDALGRRPSDWSGEHSVSFVLTDNHLQVTHNGDPFNEGDVRAICEFDESTKGENLTEIGRFGIGFKSVYAYTDRPEIYSNDEHFAIEDYIYPHKIESIQHDDVEKTVFKMPFREDVPSVGDEIATGLEKLNKRTLLFLENIDEISWKTNNDKSGRYLRESKTIDKDVRRVTLLFDESSAEMVSSEDWMIFARDVKDDHLNTSKIQIAYLLSNEDDKVIQATGCTMFARFSTEVGTDLGVLIDGPYKTTLSRDNIPSDDEWNQVLVEETAALLLESIRWLRQECKLDAEALSCLPLRHPSNELLQPLYSCTKDAFMSDEPFFPKCGGGYISSVQSLLASSTELQQLLSEEQIVDLFDGKSGWIDTTLTRNQNLLDYLTDQLEITEIRPRTIISRLSGAFLERQPDKWIEQLYIFFNRQRFLLDLLKNAPIVRLEKGLHVRPSPKNIFLPTGQNTNYDTVHHSVCGQDEAIEFLKRLGLREWDNVDDAVDNILSKYQDESNEIGEEEYQKDILRLVQVWQSSSGNKQDRLETALKSAFFVRSIDAGRPSTVQYCRPESIYFGQDDLKELFAGIKGIKFIDPELQKQINLRGHHMLKSCGIRDSLQPESVEYSSYNSVLNTPRFSVDELKEMRRQNGNSKITLKRGEIVLDWKLRDVSQLMKTLPDMCVADRISRSKLLWKMLADIDQDKFEGRYEWFYKTPHYNKFPSEFVDSLNQERWIPDHDGYLHPPIEIDIEYLNWPVNDWLLTQIKFKPRTLAWALEDAGYPVEWSQVISQAEREGMSPEHIRKLLKQRESDSNSSARHQDGTSVAAQILQQQVQEPRGGDLRRVVFPNAGPSTAESARRSIDELRNIPAAARWKVETIEKRVAGFDIQRLIDNFTNMVKGDYGKRCQICGFTFDKTDGDNQIFIIHLVPPRQHSLSPHFGNLIGLCGLHYSIFQYGQWAFWNPTDASPLQREDELRDVVLAATEKIDERGNVFFGLPIAFWNVYWHWEEAPETYRTEIRYSEPHWKYLCEILQA